VAINIFYIYSSIEIYNGFIGAGFDASHAQSAFFSIDPG
jgi:hypothetical protein